MWENIFIFGSNFRRMPTFTFQMGASARWTIFGVNGLSSWRPCMCLYKYCRYVNVCAATHIRIIFFDPFKYIYWIYAANVTQYLWSHCVKWPKIHNESRCFVTAISILLRIIQITMKNYIETMYALVLYVKVFVLSLSHSPLAVFSTCFTYHIFFLNKIFDSTSILVGLFAKQEKRRRDKNNRTKKKNERGSKGEK